MNILTFFEIDLLQFLLILIVAILVGIGKAGLSGTIMLAIPVLAVILGARNSTGMMLLFFIIGDVFAVREYYLGANWQEIRKLLPAAFIGIVLGALTGSMINDQQFKYAIAVLVLICLILMIYQQLRGASIKLPKSQLLITFTGTASGFSSMVGNAAGPIFSVYLLAKDLAKSNFLGTTAVFFMIINLIKLPVQIFIWHSVGWKEILLALILTPVIYIGIRIGVLLIGIMNEKTFRFLILIMTAIAAVRMFF